MRAVGRVQFSRFVGLLPTRQGACIRTRRGTAPTRWIPAPYEIVCASNPHPLKPSAIRSREEQYVDPDVRRSHDREVTPIERRDSWDFIAFRKCDYRGVNRAKREIVVIKLRVLIFEANHRAPPIRSRSDHLSDRIGNEPHLCSTIAPRKSSDTVMPRHRASSWSQASRSFGTSTMISFTG